MTSHYVKSRTVSIISTTRKAQDNQREDSFSILQWHNFSQNPVGCHARILMLPLRQSFLFHFSHCTDFPSRHSPHLSTCWLNKILCSPFFKQIKNKELWRKWINNLITVDLAASVSNSSSFNFSSISDSSAYR